MQSHEGFIRILPTLPQNWRTGIIAGLKARGNIEVDIEWNDGKLYRLGLRSIKEQNKKIVYNNEEILLIMKPDQIIWLDGDLNSLK